MYENQRQTQPQHLAWHETMEMHETVAFQSNHLMAFKMHMAEVKEAGLRQLYQETIRSLEQNLKELLPYYQAAPTSELRAGTDDKTAFFATHLLLFAKTAVRNYAIAITETATPALRDTFLKQLNQAIMLHGKVFAYMQSKGLYPAYDLKLLLASDQKNAAEALKMK
ncbi:Spore coat protein F [Cohnella sp. JJ-181]|nr:Spore coat protein F [Cohnella sp. JJ-181]